jgi:hypothetical protein
MKNLIFATLLFFLPMGKPGASVYTPSSIVENAPRVNGIFAFGMGKNFPQSASLKLPYVSGMSSIFTWESLEPEEGKYDFSEIDKQLQWAGKNKKTLNFCLYAGNKSPGWLSGKGIPYIQWSRRWREDQARLKQATQENEEAPAFWDDAYLGYWKKLVDKLAERYGTNPVLGYVSITGPTPKDLSTGTVIRYDEDWQKVKEAGYTPEKHQAAWKAMIDHYVTVFPSKSLVVALGPLRPGSTDLGLSETVMNYVIGKKYDNVQFLCVILNDTWFVTSGISQRLRNLFKEGARQGHGFGYQLVYSAQKMQGFQKGENKQINDFGKTLEIAIDDGASWIEIWHDDIIHPKFKQEGKPNDQYTAAIQQAYQQLTR